jgi:hypothetical protein
MPRSSRTSHWTGTPQVPILGGYAPEALSPVPCEARTALVLVVHHGVGAGFGAALGAVVARAPMQPGVIAGAK